MVRVGPLCVDRYEASIWSQADGSGTAYGVGPGQVAYPATFPPNGNAAAPLYAVSRAGVLPSTRVTWFQAQQACAASGKRLLTNAEWQTAAAGTPDGGHDAASAPCNIFGRGLVPTGSLPGCASRHGVHDLVGNAWEWVADWVHGNASPWAPVHAHHTADYGEDWVYMLNRATMQGGQQNQFPTALVRGGGWNQGKAAGIFAIYGDAAPSVPIIGPTDGDMGFRCAR
jgi:formylglycine-generating enzyme required for sulfatase activity